MMLQHILVFLSAALALGASPGANNLLAFTSAATSGWRRAAIGVLGRIAAWTVLVVLVSLGLDAILRTSEFAFVTLKWLGVLYLLYLAWQFWRADVSTEIVTPTTSRLMRREFWTLMGNPKAYLLLTSFLPQFVDQTAAVTPQHLTLGVLYIVAEGLAALLWVSAGTLFGAHALTPLKRRILNRASAGLMVAAAIFLARSERSAAV